MRTRFVLVGALLLAAGCKEKVKPEFVDRDEPLPENSRPWKIASAYSAAPAAVASGAMVLDHPPNETTQPEELALGANGWTCWPDDPRTPADDPVCKDEGGLEWDYAVQARRAPRIATMGMVYRLHGGDSITAEPYIGIIVANPQRTLAGLPTTRQQDKPWVAFAGTPWAMLIVPAGSRR